MARRLATILELCDYVGGVSERTARQWIADGRIPSYRIGDRLIRVDLNEVDERLLEPIAAPSAPKRKTYGERHAGRFVRATKPGAAS